MKNRITPAWINNLPDNSIFVFGSNLAGRHGAGAALIAKQKWGAISGKSSGLQGRTYGIPTKDCRVQVDPHCKITLEISEIKPYVNEFIKFAKSNPGLIFLVTEIGCRRADHSPETIAPLFLEAMQVSNIYLPERFWKVLISNK